MSYPSKSGITVQGQPGYQVLATGLGEDTGGGLFSFDGARVERIDRLSSTGLSVAGDRLLRLLTTKAELPVGELLVYDCHGVKAYFRLDDLADPHDIVWDGNNYAAVSTMDNSILWISPSGEIERKWQANGEEDSWHLNSLLIKDGELFASAFGKFEIHREWDQHKTDGSGFVFNVGTGTEIIKNLSQPHNPRFFDGAWAVCNSALQEVLQIDAATGLRLRTLGLKGYTRGLAISDDLIFVGESAKRTEVAEEKTACIAVISRKDWTLVDRFPLSCQEIYDLALVPPSLLEGARRGFRTNPQRVNEQSQYSMFDQVGVQPTRLWATGEPLPAEACKARIEAGVPAELSPDSIIRVDCIIENLGTAIWVSSPPFPVCVSYRWIDKASGQLIEADGLRSSLPHPLPPQRSVACRFKLKTPGKEGEYILRITLVQEHVAWFDNLDEANSYSTVVSIAKSRCTADIL